jgi:hypothetical protein
MDPLHASVAPVAAERHPLQPGSPQADSAGEAASPHAAADADFFTGAAPPLVAPPGEQARTAGCRHCALACCPTGAAQQR